MAKATSERLAVSRAGTVLRLTLSHPASRNSLSGAMMESLETALGVASTDPGVHHAVATAPRNAPTLPNSHSRLLQASHRLTVRELGSYAC